MILLEYGIAIISLCLNIIVVYYTIRYFCIDRDFLPSRYITRAPFRNRQADAVYNPLVDDENNDDDDDDHNDHDDDDHNDNNNSGQRNITIFSVV